MESHQDFFFSHEKLDVYRDIAHGSSLESAAALDVLVAKARLTRDQIQPGKASLQKIVRMLMGLIKANSTRDYEKTDPDSPPQP